MENKIMGTLNRKSPEEIDKKYEEGVAKLARKETSLREYLIGTNLTKDEIIRIDNELKEQARMADVHNEMNKQLGHKRYSVELAGELENLRNSNLYLKSWDEREGGYNERELQGEIKGKKVKIRRTGIDDDDPETKYWGTIDGKKIIKEDAEAIYKKYFRVAYVRTREIHRLKKDKLAQKAKAKKDETKKKTSKEVNDILK